MRAVVKSASRGEDSMQTTVAKMVTTQQRRGMENVMKWPKIKTNVKW
jgi:hypothetical protein